MECSADRNNGTQALDEVAQRRRRERKRMQNRNSQKLSREKQASYTRALEHIVNSIDKWDPNSSEAPSPMVKTMMQLRDENRDLRELVLRMRKRFLSLSTMAATDAGKRPQFLCSKYNIRSPYWLLYKCIDDCILDLGLDTERTNVLSNSKSDAFPPVIQPSRERQMPTCLESHGSSSCYMPIIDTANFTINTFPTIQDNITASSLINSPQQVHAQPDFSDSYADTAILNSTSAISDGAQKLLRTEASVKKVVSEMEERGKLDSQTLSQVLGPAIQLSEFILSRKCL